MKERTPYEHVVHALAEAGCNRLAVCDGPNKRPHPGASKLEFWTVPGKPHGHLVIIQRWLDEHGGLDVYVQQREHRTVESIAAILRGELE